MDHHTLERLVCKLRTRCRIDAVAEAALLALPFTVRTMPRGQYIVREGDIARRACVLLDGFAYRQKILDDGGRQIVALQVPGDAVDLQNTLLKVADHNVQALTAVVAAEIPRAAILDIAGKHPSVAHAFWLDTLVDGAIAFEWIANIGRRDARRRLAHLLCECAIRLQVSGGRDGETFTLPLTQEQLSDILGLTGVHINRTLRQLAAEGLIARDRQAIRILDDRALRNAGGFTPAYLHLDLLDD